MRSTFLVIAAALSVGAAAPTLAAPKHLNPKNPTPSYDTCEALAVERGVPPGEGHANNPDAHHDAFIRACLNGKIPPSRSLGKAQ